MPMPSPSQVPLAKNVKVTLPVGVPAPVPETVAESCMIVPRGTDPPLGITSWLALCNAVTVVLSALLTLKGSQPEVDTL